MKKIVLLVLAFALCLSLCACGAPAQTNESATPAPSKEAIAPTEAAASEETAAPESVTAPEETAAPSESAPELIDGMRPEFKEAMDSFELFFTEYCDFMQKYAENPSDLGLLAEYASMMEQYADTMAKLEEWEDDELNDSELTYYLEVTTRITQMLAEVSG